MKIEFVTKEIAYQKYLELKNLAWAVAGANNTVPAESTSPECKLFMRFAELATDLKNHQFCIFINGTPAEHLTESEIAPGEYIISKICCQNVEAVAIENGILKIKYFDGVVESFSFIEEIKAWKLHNKNISINVPSISAN
jgi:hypothetical protein